MDQTFTDTDANAQESIWTADRLNQELSNADGATLGFTPSGQVFRPEDADGHFPFSQLAVLHPIPVGIAANMAEILCPLPPALLLCAVNPEPWCVVFLRPDARHVAGTFRDVKAPLWEWLLRAAQIQGQVSIANCQKSTDDPKEPTWLPLPELVPKRSIADRVWLADSLAAFDLLGLGRKVKSQSDAVALSAGLWLMNDFVDQSHSLSQSVEGEGRNRAGDYWHGILHRREPDYANAKYWFRHVGPHPIHSELAGYAQQILATCRSPMGERFGAILTRGWDAFGFVDLCAEAENRADAELSMAARRIQLVEMALLLNSTYHDAVA